MDDFPITQMFLKKLFDKNCRISLDDWLSIFNESNSTLLPYWVTDYSLQECFKKMDSLNEIRTIDLTGCTLLSDQGVEWMCQYLNKCGKLNKISLRSCCNVTENSLWILRSYLDDKCTIEMDHTRVTADRKQSTFDQVKEKDFQRILNAFEKSTTYFPAKSSLMIFPSESVEISALTLLTGKAVGSTNYKYLEHKLDVKIDSDKPLVNLISYISRRVPINIPMPTISEQLIILVPDNVKEALDHIVNTIVQLTCSEVPKIEIINPNDIDVPFRSKITLNSSEICRNITATQFKIVCYGPQSQSVFEEVRKLKWVQQLQQYTMKLEQFIEKVNGKLMNKFDLSVCVQLGNATRQLNRLRELISCNQGEENHAKTISIFKFDNYNFKDVNKLLELNGSSIHNKYQSTSSRILSLDENYITEDLLRTENIMVENFTALMEKMFAEISGIYLKKFAVFIKDLDWFDKLLRQISEAQTIKAGHNVLGLHPDSLVWKKATILKVFDKNNIAILDNDLWIRILEDIGMFVRVPAIRRIRSDDSYYFVNPLLLDERNISKKTLSKYLRTDREREIFIKVQYVRICQHINHLYPLLLSKIISIGHLQLLTAAVTVIHVAGGVEVIIESNPEFIKVSASMCQPNIRNFSESKRLNLFSYVWSVLFLFTDAMDSIIFEQNMVVSKDCHVLDESVQNYSICYNHKWSASSTNCNVCTLCGNCTSKEGVQCTFNRLRYASKGRCYCFEQSLSCEDCGICKICARSHWENYCLSHPGERSFLLDKFHTTINFAMSTTIYLELFKSQTRVFIGLQKLGSDEVIDILGATSEYSNGCPLITRLPIMSTENNYYDDISVTFEEVKPHIEVTNEKRTCNYQTCINIDFNEDMGILTSIDKNGIFVGKHSLSRPIDLFAIDFINVLNGDNVVVGLVSDCYNHYNMYDTADFYIGYGSHGNFYHNFVTDDNNLDPFSVKDARIIVRILDDVSGSRGSNRRVVEFINNGKCIKRTFVAFDGEVFPIIKIYSKYVQVKLLKFLDVYNLSDYPDDFITEELKPHVANKSTVSPEDTITVINTTDAVGIIHISKAQSVKEVSFEINGPMANRVNIKSLNGLTFIQRSDNSRMFTAKKHNKNIEILTFSFEFNDSNAIESCNATIILKTSGSKLTEYKRSFANRPFYVHYKDKLEISEFTDLSPSFPAYVMTVKKNGLSRNFHISKHNYSLIIKGDRKDFFVKSSNLMTPASIRWPKIEDDVKFEKKIDKTANESKPRIKKARGPLISLVLSSIGQYNDISAINKSLLTNPPPLKVLQFCHKNDIPQGVTDDNFVPLNGCDSYHGMNICTLNFILLHDDKSRRKDDAKKIFNLPFNLRGILDVTDLLWEHSYSDLLTSAFITSYSTCKGEFYPYEPQPHILLEDSTKICDDNVHVYGSLLDSHKRILDNDFILIQISRLINQSKFSIDETIYLVSRMLEKITSFMMLNILLTDDVLLIDNATEVDSELMLNKKSTSDIVCEVHSKNRYQELDLDDLCDDYGLDNIAKTLNLRYAYYAYSIVFTGRNIEYLPENLFQGLENIRRLEFRNMFKVKDLPKNIYGLKKLQQLKISRLNIRKMPNVLLFKELIDLSISHCPISISDNHGKMSKLKRAKLWSLPLVDLPLFLCYNNELHFLEIQLNGLEMLPKEISNLDKLKKLAILGSNLYQDMIKGEISTNQICDEEFLFNYPEVGFFKLVEKGKRVRSVLSDIDSFVNVPRIGSGYSAIDDTNLYGGFPMALLQLKDLRSLSIHYQSIRAIPKEIDCLEHLEDLDLSFNPLLELIPGEITNIVTIKKIILLHCPALVQPPQDIVSSGSITILAYLKYLLAERVTCNRTKLMFVGFGNAGKTCLLNALKSPNNSAKSFMEDKEQCITEGIDIDKYRLSFFGNDSIEFSTWDFAGQDVYYNTHQFFLSPNAIYIVVLSLRRGIEFGDLDFWLSSVTCHAKNAPIFVVGTHCDQVTVNVSAFAALKERYSQIVEFYLIDSLSGTGIEKLRSAILERCQSLPYVRKTIPRLILNLETKIIELRKTKPYMELNEFMELSKGQNILYQDVHTILRILHDFGSIQYFDTEMLRNFVVINPQWIVEIMTKIVSVNNEKIKEGKFYHKDITAVWSDVDPSLHDWIMKLTEDFDLTYPDPTEKANIIPSMLPEHDKEIEWPTFPIEGNWKYNQIYYIFKFLPAGLFNRIQVRLFDFTEKKEIWKYGTYFVKNGHHVLLRRENKTKLTVRAIGVRPVNVLAMVDEVIRSLIKSYFHGVQFIVKTACPDCIEYGQSNSNIATKYWSNIKMINTSKVYKAIDKRIEFIQCSELHLNSLTSIKDISPETPSAKKFVKNMYSKLQYVQSFKVTSDKNIAMLYSTEVSSLDHDKIITIINNHGFKCKQFTEDPVSMIRWKGTISTCCLCIIILSQQFVKISAMEDVLKYVKLLKKPFLLVLTERDQVKKLCWKYGTYFNGIHVNVIQSEGNLDAKYSEIDSAVQRISDNIFNNKKDVSDCFISYCWSNSRDAVNRGTKFVEGAIGNDEADPRVLYNYLKENNIKCWIDTDRLANEKCLSKQLSQGLYNSKMMIAFISREYNKSENSMMELRFMVNALRRPVLYVIVGTNYYSEKTPEVDMIMMKNNPTVFDFSNNQTIDREQLLEKVNSILQARLPDVDRENEAQNESVSASLNEQVEIIFRQFLNQLISYSTEHCPRLVALDYDTDIGDTKDISNTGLQLRIICECEAGWHVVEDSYAIPTEKRNTLVEACAPYLCMLYQVLEHNNPGLRCLRDSSNKDRILRLEVGQSARGSSIENIQESYLNLIKYYIEVDPGLLQCTLKKYRLPSGRELWMCNEDSKRNERYRVIERDALTNESRIDPIDDNDKEILRQFKMKSAEEQSKYGKSFEFIMKYTREEIKRKTTIQEVTNQLMQKTREHSESCQDFHVMEDKPPSLLRPKSISTENVGKLRNKEKIIEKKKDKNCRLS